MTRTRTVPIERDEIQRLLAEKVSQVASEPEYHWGGSFRCFATEDNVPLVRVGILNCTPDTDIWKGLRNPAQVGMYPIGLPEIWMHHAASNIKSTRYDGSPNPLAMAEPFEEACGRYRRAVIICGMLALNPELFETYAEKIEQGDPDPPDVYRRAGKDAMNIIDRAVGKLGLALLAPTRAVVPMTVKNHDAVIDRTRSEYFKGRHHGPCNHHYPQNSIAVMTGLLRFGVDRIPFRDEIAPDGSVRRLMGRYFSVVLFDEEEPVTDGSKGIVLLDEERREWLKRVNDYTRVDKKTAAGRYCTYNMTRKDGSSICGKCITACPAGALANSSPAPDGTFSEKIRGQKHRFSGDALDFDFANCTRDRGQKAQVYEDYTCSRCEAICAARGIRKSATDVKRING